jgi:hypothetical protein
LYLYQTKVSTLLGRLGKQLFHDAMTFNVLFLVNWLKVRTQMPGRGPFVRTFSQKKLG